MFVDMKIAPRRAETWKPLREAVRDLLAKAGVTDGKISVARVVRGADHGQEPELLGKNGEEIRPSPTPASMLSGGDARPGEGNRDVGIKRTSKHALAKVAPHGAAAKFEYAPIPCRVRGGEAITPHVQRLPAFVHL